MSDEPLLLTLDLGTTNCKAVVFDVRGRELLREQASYPTYSRGEGAFEQRPADWLTAAEQVLAHVGGRLEQDANRLAGLALSGWGPGLVFVSQEGEPLNDASPTWQDARAAPYGERLIAEFGADWIGGGIPTTGFPAKLAWARDAWPEAAARAAFALGVKEVILQWLTGTVATEASSGPYAAQWPAAVVEAAGWSLDRLPPVLAPTEIGGTLLPQRARRLRLPAGLPVVMGLNDGASATLGVGCHRAGDGVVSLSTNGVLRLLLDSRPDTAACVESSLFRYPLVEGLWVTGGFALSGADSLRWLVETTAPDTGQTGYEQVLAEASACAAGANGLLFLPYLAGRGTPRPKPEAAGAFLGLRAGHRRGHLARAVLEGVAFALREIADALARYDWRIERLLITGGGARSALWREIVASTLEFDVRHAEGDSNLGAAIVLAVAVGIYPTFADATAEMTESSVTPPRGDDVDTYATAFASYRAAGTLLYG